MKNEQPFATCPGCQHIWETRDDFLDDSMVLITGYQANLDDLPEGLFLFNHTIHDCRATISIKAKEFLNLYSGIQYPESKALMENCPRYCMDEHNLQRCDEMCECAFVREVIALLVKRRVKSSSYTFLS